MKMSQWNFVELIYTNFKKTAHKPSLLSRRVDSCCLSLGVSFVDKAGAFLSEVQTCRSGRDLAG
jgi:hypothetical protein